MKKSIKTKSKDVEMFSNDENLSLEELENNLYKLAMIQAEKQLREGTASAQVITHFLKIGSTREKIEKEILEEQKKLVEAKTEALQSTKIIEELYTNAVAAFKRYGGNYNDE